MADEQHPVPRDAHSDLPTQRVTCPRCNLLIGTDGKHEVRTKGDRLRFVLMHYQTDPALMEWCKKHVTLHVPAPPPVPG